MLPAPNRLRRSADFTTVLRTGQRAARPTMIVHAATVPPNLAARPTPTARPTTADTARGTAAPHRVGLIVGRSVGNSVVRHRVSRRLRALMAARLDRLPGRTDVVIRALPAAATADCARLAQDVDRAIARLVLRPGHPDRSPPVAPHTDPATTTTASR